MTAVAAREPVTFYVPNEPDLARYGRMDTDWVRMKQQPCSTVQTFLRRRDAEKNPARG
jgi:hypothetical protein